MRHAHYVLTALTALLVAPFVLAQDGALPHTFESGDVIRADEMNANFKALLDLATSGIVLPDTCAAGQILSWDGEAWACAADAVGPDSATYSAGPGLTLDDTTFSVDFNEAAPAGHDHAGDYLDATAPVVAGTIEVESVTYSTARQHFASVSGLAFTPESSSLDYTKGIDGYGTCINAGAGSLYAGIQIPEGAEIVSVEFIYEDNSSSDLELMLRRLRFTGAVYPVVDGTTSGAISGYASKRFHTFNTDFGDGGIAQNEKNAYVVRVRSDAWDCSMNIRHVSVGYELNEAP